MKITISTNDGIKHLSIFPETINVYEIMEGISNLLLSTNFNYLSIIKAHEAEVERMNEAIKKGDDDD